MNLPRFSVQNSVFVNLILILILVGGVGSWLTSNKEVFPSLDLNLVTVTTVYSRASPEEVEKTVTIPIENAVEAVEGVDEVVSQSLEGRSLVLIEVDRSYETRRVADDVRAELDRLDELPEDAEDPVVVSVKTTFPVINVAVGGDVPETVLREVARDLKDEVLGISGVNQVFISGIRDPRIQIDLRLDRALAYGIDLLAVVDAVRRRNVTLPAGTTRNPLQEWGLRTEGEFADAAAARRMVILRRAGGGVVRLGDVAQVEEGFEEPVTLSRVRGQPALNLSIFKKREGDTIEIAEAVRQLVPQWQRGLPDGVTLTLNQDNSRWIRKRLETMFTSARLGFLLVCLTLFVFLDWRVAIWTAAGIPVSFLGAAFLMKLTGISINMLSLFSFIVVLGMVVDDAVVIAENIYRHRQLGVPAREAAIRGATEVALPVTAAVMTTVAAFVPMLVMTGTMGKFMSVIPKVVTFALLISLVEALIILPSHLSHVKKVKTSRGKRRDGPFYRALRRMYTALLTRAVRYRYVTVLLAFSLAFGVGVLAKSRLRFVLFYGKDLPAFMVNLEAPPGTPIERASLLAEQVERVAQQLPKADLDAYVTLVGGQIDPATGRVKVGENLGQVYFELSEFETPGRRNGFVVADEVRDALRIVRGAVVEVQNIQAGPPVGKPVDARIKGDDFGPMRRAVEELREYLNTLPGVKDVRDDYRPGRNELRVVVEEERAAYYGVSAETVALTLRAAYEGIEASNLRRGEDQVDVVVRLADADTTDPDRLGDIRLRAAGGRLVPLSAVTRIEMVKGTTEINRRGKKRAIRLTADVDNAVTTSTAVTQKLVAQFEQMQTRYPDVGLAFGGEQKEQAESVESLRRAFLFVLVGIYVILGGLFRSAVQPLLIMLAIPFGAVGVLIGHLVLGEPVGLLTLIGLTALTGIVVNDSLILVDFVNQSRRRGAGRWRSVLKSGRVRLRPVLLTSITTIAGFGNLAVKTTGQAAFLAPMAISVVWGLAFATGLILVFIPALVAVADDAKAAVRRLSRSRAADHSEPQPNST
jgi:multidrug efflux pump subunit AcrB